MASYKVSRNQKAGAITCCLFGLFLVGAGIYALATEDFHWIFVVSIGLFGSLTGLAIRGLIQMSRANVVVDDEAIEFVKGDHRRRYLWSQLQSVRLNSGPTLTMQLRSDVRHESLSEYAERQKLVEEIVHHAEPRGLLDLPHDGTRYGLERHRWQIVFPVVLMLLLSLGILATSLPVQPDDDWMGVSLAVTFFALALLLAPFLKDSFRLRGNQLFVINWGREKRIFLNQPYTFFKANGLCMLQQGATRCVIRPQIDGSYNLLRLLQKSGEEGRLATPQPNVKMHRRDRFFQIVILTVCAIFFGGLVVKGFSAQQRVLEPMRYADRDPVQTSGMIVGSSGGLITYEYRVASVIYQQKDYVKGQPNVGESLQVTYWRVNPHMSYTTLSVREGRATAMLVNNLMLIALLATVGLLIFFRRKKVFAKGEDEPLS